jgi:hypothetical protein
VPSAVSGEYSAETVGTTMRAGPKPEKPLIVYASKAAPSQMSSVVNPISPY